MDIRRILALVALLASVVACTSAEPSAPDSPAATGRGVVTLPRGIEKLVGPADQDARLQAYVDRVGQRVVAAAGVSGFRFVVLDSPVANAHAVQSYVFVTRGLLALLENEAELAAAVGHELGHLVQRHAAQRARVRQSVLEAAIDAAAASGSVTVGRAVAQDGLLALRRYSREQELEADRLGLGYIVKAGYRGDAMASLIERLRQQSALEAQIMGESPDVGDRPSAASTHPVPIERTSAIAGLPLANAPGETNEKGYFAAINGMSVDDSPREGFIRGRTFLHPTMRLAFTAPPGFRLLNDSDGVLAVNRDRSLMLLACVATQIPGPLDDWMRNKLKPTPTDIRTLEINGNEAAIGARPRGSDTGLGQARYVVIRDGDRVCNFALVSEGAHQDRQIEEMVRAARTFRTLTPAEAAALQPYRLRIVSPAGSTPAQLAARMPYPDLKMERLLVLNAAQTPAELASRAQIKIIEP
ncbi:M48 family metalloprotease [Reyranella sp.]|uniref:M48 family metalloprotease n=1 Tax=Reyranella sp. TaxID=1929291 RepID=UPI003C7DC6B2